MGVVGRWRSRSPGGELPACCSSPSKKSFVGCDSRANLQKVGQASSIFGCAGPSRLTGRLSHLPAVCCRSVARLPLSFLPSARPRPSLARVFADALPTLPRRAARRERLFPCYTARMPSLLTAREGRSFCAGPSAWPSAVRNRSQSAGSDRTGRSRRLRLCAIAHCAAAGRRSR